MATLGPVPPGREHWVVSPAAHAAQFVSGYRGSTRASYGRVLRRWLHFCEDTHLDPWSVDRRHIEAWLATMPPRAAQHAATVVCGFYRDAHGMGVTDRDLAWGVRRPRVGRGPAGTWASPDELRRMLDIAEDDGGDTFALVALLALTGARLGESLALTVDHVEGREPLRLRFDRKMGHIDILTMPPMVERAFAPLLDKRTTGALLRWQGRPMRAGEARAIVSSIAERAGCEQRITPHSLRRSFVTFARDLGVSDAEIMAMTGHVDASMIDFYDRGRRQRDGEAAKAVELGLQNHHPR